VKQQLHQENTENLWLALEIGNSRLHWALFAGEKLSKTWDSDYLSV
jgi:type III pantothenate kinase